MQPPPNAGECTRQIALGFGFAQAFWLSESNANYFRRSIENRSASISSNGVGVRC